MKVFQSKFSAHTYLICPPHLDEAELGKQIKIIKDFSFLTNIAANDLLLGCLRSERSRRKVTLILHIDSIWITNIQVYISLFPSFIVGARNQLQEKLKEAKADEFPASPLNVIALLDHVSRAGGTGLILAPGHTASEVFSINHHIMSFRVMESNLFNHDAILSLNFGRDYSTGFGKNNRMLTSLDYSKLGAYNFDPLIYFFSCVDNYFETASELDQFMRQIEGSYSNYKLNEPALSCLQYAISIFSVIMFLARKLNTTIEGVPYSLNVVVASKTKGFSYVYNVPGKGISLSPLDLNKAMCYFDRAQGKNLFVIVDPISMCMRGIAAWDLNMGSPPDSKDMLHRIGDVGAYCKLQNHSMDLYLTSSPGGRYFFNGVQIRTTSLANAEDSLGKFKIDGKLSARILGIIECLYEKQRSAIIVICSSADHGKFRISDDSRDTLHFAELNRCEVSQKFPDLNAVSLSVEDWADIFRLDGAHFLSEEGEYFSGCIQIKENEKVLSEEKTKVDAWNHRDGEGTGTHNARILSIYFNSSLVIKVSASKAIKVYRNGELL